MKTKHEIMEELKQKQEELQLLEEQEKYMEKAPLPQKTQEAVVNIDYLWLELKRQTRRKLDLLDQISNPKRLAIEELSEYRQNRPATLREMNQKVDECIVIINDVIKELFALGVTQKQIDEVVNSL